MFLFFLSNLLKKGPTPPLTVFLAQLMLLFFLLPPFLCLFSDVVFPDSD